MEVTAIRTSWWKRIGSKTVPGRIRKEEHDMVAWKNLDTLESYKALASK